MTDMLSVDHLSVGYDGRSLIRDIAFSVPRGTILTLIGPNGAGKSTILKTLTRHLMPIAGTVYIAGEPLRGMSYRALAKKLSVVLTERARPELMSCYDVVAAGRYPYTGRFGALTSHDHEIVREALRRTRTEDIAGRDFMHISDGQRQRVMLARALAQEPEIIVLDEPTSFLDIRHKIELLNILMAMSREQGLTVILSLHEIELAAKVSDLVMCVKGERIGRIGPPEEIFTPEVIADLYDMEMGSYNALFGSAELARPEGEPRVFVTGGGGFGVPCYRALQRRRVPFAAGILFENDMDLPVARALSRHVVTSPAFEPMAESAFQEAAALLMGCGEVWDAGTPIGALNALNGRLMDLARERHIPVIKRQA